MARALLDQETIGGDAVGRLVDEAYGRPVHVAGAKSVPKFVGNGHGEESATNGASVPAANGQGAASAGSSAPSGATPPWPPPAAWPPPANPAPPGTGQSD